MTEKHGKLELIAIKTVPEYNELYKIVDFLNKSLKEKHVMFGLTKNTQDGTMTISVYET